MGGSGWVLARASWVGLGRVWKLLGRDGSVSISACGDAASKDAERSIKKRKSTAEDGCSNSFSRTSPENNRIGTVTALLSCRETRPRWRTRSIVMGHRWTFRIRYSIPTSVFSYSLRPSSNHIKRESYNGNESSMNACTCTVWMWNNASIYVARNSVGIMKGATENAARCGVGGKWAWVVNPGPDFRNILRRIYDHKFAIIYCHNFRLHVCFSETYRLNINRHKWPLCSLS